MAAQWSVNIDYAGEKRGSKYTLLSPPPFLNILFLPTTSCPINKPPSRKRAENQYPKILDHNDLKGNQLNFPSATCPKNDDARKEYPLKVGDRYDRGQNNRNQGDERVVYYHEEGEISYGGSPQVYFCGIITHIGAAAGGFLMC